MKYLALLLLCGCSGIGETIIDSSTVVQCKLASESAKQAIADEYWAGPVSEKKKAQLQERFGEFTFRCAILESIIVLEEADLGEHGMEALARFEAEL